VLHAVSALTKITSEELHNHERPIAYLAFQTAEMNRDKKKKNKPYRMEEFYFYADKEKENLPDSRYGAAALAMISRKIFPSWALFVYKELKERANNALPPELLCVQCEDAILLAPSIEEMSIRGMLIANEKASGQTRTMTSPCGLEVDVNIPVLNGKYEATEDTELRLVRSPRKAQPA